jgi:Transposase, Mutator family
MPSYGGIGRWNGPDPALKGTVVQGIEQARVRSADREGAPMLTVVTGGEPTPATPTAADAVAVDVVTAVVGGTGRSATTVTRPTAHYVFDGARELIARTEGYRESTGSWADLLRDCKPRGMRALGFWAALREVFPDTCEQRCWFHKIAAKFGRLPCSALDSPTHHRPPPHQGDQGTVNAPTSSPWSGTCFERGMLVERPPSPTSIDAKTA